MATRSAAQAREEEAIFDAFLTAHPSFAVEVKDVEQPDDEFPDIVTIMKDGSEIDFELGEWLDGAQMGAAKRYDDVARAITDAVGPQGPDPSRHFRAAMLCPVEGVRRFEPADRVGFRAELWRLVTETQRRWPAEPLWHSPQGHVCRDLADYPLLAKYIRSVNFDPLVVRGEPHPWPAGQPWIFVELRGGSYSPETALQALWGILDRKISHYAPFSRPTRLIIYYCKAIMYNTPYVGIETEEFADVVTPAAAVVLGQKAFEKIYLLNALRPGLEAFEIYPACRRCS